MSKNLNLREMLGQIVASRYRLDQYLGEGGFGAVFRATHLAYGTELREVAVKVAKRPLTDSEAHQIFGDAILMAKVAANAPDAALRDHFVTVYDAGRCPDDEQLAGHPYLVMEFVPGGSLGRCLRAGPFPLTRAVAYFDQILQALAFMHGWDAQGLAVRSAFIHRDLKPDNILVVRRTDAPDLLKVTDFGLAVEVDTLLGWVESSGDLTYLAPESFSHNLSSPQSDVYMLGLVFYEMLTGVNPFHEVGRHLRGNDQDKHAELRRLHLAARQMETFALLDANAEIQQRPALGQVIRAALTTDMSSRPYNNAGELLQAWRAAKEGKPPPDDVFPWDTVRRLTNEAEQCFAVGEAERGASLLRQAMALNRDSECVPDRMVVGCAYLLTVKQLLGRQQVEEAGRVALEGHRRHKCRSTCLAMSKYYETLDSPLAARFEQEAAACVDQE